MVVVCLGLVLAGLGAQPWAAKDDLDLVSRAAGAAGDKGNGFSAEPAVSADGRFVAFTSIASNLHPDDGDATEDVFRRDVLGPPPEQRPAQQAPAQPPAGDALQTRPGCPFAGNLIVGTNGDDERSGGPLSDIVLGRAGDDLLRGLGGADCIFGQRGADRLLGGSGRDRLFGGPGGDRLLGGGGAGRLSTGRGRDRLRGGRGGDRIKPGSGRDRIAAAPGDDRVRARGAARDAIDRGPGRLDVAIVDRLDATRGCERVRLR